MLFLKKILLNILICSIFSVIRLHLYSAITSPDVLPNELLSDGLQNKRSTGSLGDTKEPNDDDNFLDDCNSPQLECRDLNATCFDCRFDYHCEYGKKMQSKCRVISAAKCKGSRVFERMHTCEFCYQLPQSHYQCSNITSCQFQSRFRTTCTANKDIICLGYRKFSKYVKCEFQNNYKWTTVLFLSVTLGGFGVDRFYLGNWQEGLGKLFSFGGLGVWTLIDVILIATGYLKPQDGSLYT